jgi:SpoVK/Ycf46/Vps4 family AAA+-type ATPase
MDGAAGDADLLFLLTTNRADLLELALAARPGRVDVAVEIALPDGPARERLLALYGRGVPLELTADDIAAAIERTEGVTASFLKELIRRAVLEALHETAPDTEAGLPAVTGAHLARALDDLLDSAQGVTRTLLGVGVDPTTLPAAFVGTEFPLAAFLRVIPDLNLRGCPQIDAAVGFGNRLVFDQKLDVTQFFVGGQVGSISVVDQNAAFDGPVLLRILGPFLDLSLTLFFRHRGELVRVEMRHPMPAGKIFAVE